MKNITIGVDINAPVEQVWSAWITTEDVVKWNFASDEWCCPKAENDLAVGKMFNYRMEAKDGSMGFDFKGTYSKIIVNELIEFSLEDNRKVQVKFTSNDLSTKVEEVFEAEDDNSAEMQKNGWQSILNNFKNYVEITKTKDI